MRELVRSHRNEAEPSPKYDVAASLQTIEAMDAAHAVHAFAVLVLCFQHICVEKTVDGWANGQVPGQQWRAGNFLSAYMARPGRQVAYDALVVLAPIVGLGAEARSKTMVVDKLQLVLWSNLEVEAAP